MCLDLHCYTDLVWDIPDFGAKNVFDDITAKPQKLIGD